MRYSLTQLASLLACAGVAFASHDSSLRPPHLSRRAVSCSKTADCTAAGVSIPSNSHQFCKSGSCSFKCNTNYSLISGACVKTVTSTSTTSSAGPSSTIKSCSKTADCDGATIPANSHQYCRSKVCSFNCNSKYTLVDGACVGAGSLTTTSSAASASATSITCSKTADCTAAEQVIPANSHQWCDSSAKKCSWRCNSGYSTLGDGCTKDASTSSTTSSTSTASTTASASSSTSTSAVTSSRTSSAPSSSSSAAASASSGGPVLRKAYTGADLFNENDWIFETFDGEEPTHGRVNYVDGPTARSLGLISSPNNVARLSIDRTSWLSSDAYRNSVRVTTPLNDSLNAGSLLLIDMAHAPWGCSVWSAAWTVGRNWPNQGEIDIYEDGCSRDTSLAQTGDTSTTFSDCSVYNTGNAGCSVLDYDPTSFGSGFNAAGGGVFAVAIETSGISIWRWKRSAIPADISSSSPNPSTWGTPVARWGSSTCAPSFFKDQQIVFDITTCGDWAGDQWVWQSTADSGSCYPKYATCAAANQDPANFAEAYFDVNYIKVFSI
ncbi:hypothetical protein BCR35DRAFT_312496 [Leucosporidium creatinivorum]|uniref:Concanavalin A-like lectin/glucanase domain-containing protein n=1 Tax=Leucosporidium creatinivorum TaxID=106004 RepID=A0A1Y2G0K2_9BASI|nr:hypothetical protein BCR35DRAFT_312496 [Leucosporidium creatinivorum]